KRVITTSRVKSFHGEPRPPKLEAHWDHEPPAESFLEYQALAHRFMERLRDGLFVVAGYSFRRKESFTTALAAGRNAAQDRQWLNRRPWRFRHRPGCPHPNRSSRHRSTGSYTGHDR